MKNTTFKGEVTDLAVQVQREHVKANLDGLPLYNGKSHSKLYYGRVRVYETKGYIVVEDLV